MLFEVSRDENAETPAATALNEVTLMVIEIGRRIRNEYLQVAVTPLSEQKSFPLLVNYVFPAAR